METLTEQMAIKASIRASVMAMWAKLCSPDRARIEFSGTTLCEVYGFPFCSRPSHGEKIPPNKKQVSRFSWTPPTPPCPPPTHLWPPSWRPPSQTPQGLQGLEAPPGPPPAPRGASQGLSLLVSVCSKWAPGSASQVSLIKQLVVSCGFLSGNPWVHSTTFPTYPHQQEQGGVRIETPKTGKTCAEVDRESASPTPKPLLLTLPAASI